MLCTPALQISVYLSLLWVFWLLYLFCISCQWLIIAAQPPTYQVTGPHLNHGGDLFHGAMCLLGRVQRLGSSGCSQRKRLLLRITMSERPALVVISVELLSHVWLTPGSPVLHYLPEFAQTPCRLSQWCHPTISASVVPFSSCHQSFPASGSFPMSQLFASDNQCIGASASASVLPLNIQGWFPLGLTGWISVQSKGLSRVFSSTAILKHQFFRLR